MLYGSLEKPSTDWDDRGGEGKKGISRGRVAVDAKGIEDRKRFVRVCIFKETTNQGIRLILSGDGGEKKRL